MDRAIQENLAALSSPEMLAAIDADPYWPKWDGAWWRLTLLWEMGLAERAPRATVAAWARSMNALWLRTFPRPGELPPGKDPYRHVVCHCALGTAFQVLAACGFDPDRELEWARGWFLRYQLPDGGLNCDEIAYAKPDPHGSFLSTLPPLEAVLRCTPRPFTPEEEAFLDRGARYLLDRRLFRRASDGAVINEEWRTPCFPRFYDYDVLRGLSFVTHWAVALERPLPAEAVAEAVALMESSFPDGAVAPGRRALERARTLAPGPDGPWSGREPARRFPLLAAVSEPGRPSPALSFEWARVRERLAALRAAGLCRPGAVDQ